MSQRKIICFLVLWSEEISHSKQKRLRCTDYTPCKICTMMSPTGWLRCWCLRNALAACQWHSDWLLFEKIKAPRGDKSRLFPLSPAGSEVRQPGVTEWVWTRLDTGGADVYKCVNTNPYACVRTLTQADSFVPSCSSHSGKWGHFYWFYCVCACFHLDCMDILLHLVVDLRYHDERHCLLKTVAELRKKNKT